MNKESKRVTVVGYHYDGDDIVTSYVSVPSGVVPDETVGGRLQIMGWSELKDHPLPKDFRKYVMRSAYAAGIEHCFFVKGELFFGPVTIGPSPLPFWVNLALTKKAVKDPSLFGIVLGPDETKREAADLALKDALQKRIDNLFRDVWKDARQEAIGLPDRGDDMAVRSEQLGADADSGQGPGQVPA